jgi:exonuclease SbcC
MIKTIRLKNFASHKDSVLELSPGLNVITGATHNGKSVIHKGLEWVFLNNIHSGFRPLTYSVDKKDPSSVEIEFDDGNIIRERDGRVSEGTNGYRWEQDDRNGICEALRKDVPDEIFSIARIDQINIQGQEDDRFLLSKHTSPGDVAKKLNEFVGLTVIDTVLDNAKSNVGDINKELEKTKKDLISSEEEINKLEYLDTLKPLFEEIDSLTLRQSELESKVGRVSELASLVDDIQGRINDNKEWLESKSLVLEIESILTKGIDLNNKINTVGMLSNEVSKLRSKIDKSKSLLKGKQIVEDIEHNLNRMKELTSKATAVDTLRRSINHFNNRIGLSKLFLASKSVVSDIEILTEKQRVMFSLKGKVENVQSNVLNIRSKIHDSKTALKGTKDKLNEVLKSIKVCPIFDVNCPLQKGK